MREEIHETRKLMHTQTYVIIVHMYVRIYMYTYMT